VTVAPLAEFGCVNCVDWISVVCSFVGLGLVELYCV